MFYEDYRIVRKQRIFINSKAVEMISDFRSKGLKHDEIVGALELLLKDKDGTEIHVDIVKRALLILKDSKECDEKENENI